MSEEVLPVLIRQTLSPDLLKRHGSLLGIAEILLGLAKYPYPISPGLVQEISQVGGETADWTSTTAAMKSLVSDVYYMHDLLALLAAGPSNRKGQIIPRSRWGVDS